LFEIKMPLENVYANEEAVIIASRLRERGPAVG
jgi:hypothetical protein